MTMIKRQVWKFREGQRSLLLRTTLDDDSSRISELAAESISWMIYPVNTGQYQGVDVRRNRQIMMGLVLTADRCQVIDADENRFKVSIDGMLIDAEAMNVEFTWDGLVRMTIRLKPYQVDYIPLTGDVYATVLNRSWLERQGLPYCEISLQEVAQAVSQLISGTAFQSEPEDISAAQTEINQAISRLAARPGWLEQQKSMFIACRGCSNFYGRNDGGNFLVCAIHPYGNGQDCSDFEPKALPNDIR